MKVVRMEMEEMEKEEMVNGESLAALVSTPEKPPSGSAPPPPTVSRLPPPPCPHPLSITSKPCHLTCPRVPQD